MLPRGHCPHWTTNHSIRQPLDHVDDSREGSNGYQMSVVCLSLTHIPSMHTDAHIYTCIYLWVTPIGVRGGGGGGGGGGEASPPSPLRFSKCQYSGMYDPISVHVKELISALLGVWLGTAPFGVKLMGDLALSDWSSTRFRVNLATRRWLRKKIYGQEVTAPPPPGPRKS